MTRDGSRQSAKSVGPGRLGFSSESATQLLSKDLDDDGGKLVEHEGSSTALEVSSTESSDLLGQELKAASRLNDDVQTGQDGVCLGQEVAVAQKLLLRNIGESLEHLLVFGVTLQEADHQR